MYMNKSLEEKEFLVRYYLRKRQKKASLVPIDENARRYVELIDVVLSQLKAEEREILVSEYISNCEAGWWDNYFSKSTYYRIKNLALDHFLSLIRE